MNEQKHRGCFKTGCLGCLAMLALMIGLPLLLLLISLAIGRPEEQQGSEQRRQPLPELPQSPEIPATLPPEGDPGLVERQLMPEVVTYVVPSGRMRIELEMGRFEIVPGPPGTDIEVEADYDTASFELKESFEPAADGSWNYTLVFRDKVGWLRRLSGNNVIRNKVRLIVPRGRPFALEGSVGMGESDFELGGLSLTSVQLDLGAGGHRLSFGEPSPQPLEWILLNSSYGELRTTDLGNASPARLTVNHDAGEVSLDLNGAWRQDADIEVDFNFGECRLYVPETVAVEVIRASVSLGEKRLGGLDRSEPPPPGAPTLRLSLTGTAGELSVLR